MTESLIRDTKQEGLWHVFVDGIEVGLLLAEEDAVGVISFHHIFAGQASEDYENLADAERDLMLCVRSRQRNYFTR